MAFKDNRALLGGALFSRNTSFLRINCSSTTKTPQLTFFTRKQLDSMKTIASNGDVCENWERNKAIRYGQNVTTEASSVWKEILYEDKKEIIEDGSSIVFRNYESRKTLPLIKLTLVDQLGQSPAIVPNSEIVKALLSSSDGFIVVRETLLLIEGEGSISGIVVNQYPDTYTVLVEFDQKFLKSFEIIIEVRKCVVRETAVEQEKLLRVSDAIQLPSTSFSRMGRVVNHVLKMQIATPLP